MVLPPEANNLLKKHSTDQETIGKTWIKSLNKIRETLHNKAIEKKNAIKEEISKLLAEEKRILDQLVTFEKEKTDDILRQIADNSLKTKAFDDSKIDDMKNHQMNTIWTETLQDISVVLDRQKNRIKSLDDQFKSSRPATTSVSTQNINALREQQNSVQELKANNINEFHRKQDQIHKEIEKINKDIQELDRKEREDIDKLINKSRVNENEEKEKLWTKFFEDMKKKK